MPLTAVMTGLRELRMASNGVPSVRSSSRSLHSSSALIYSFGGA
jgi:hypothetical protein